MVCWPTPPPTKASSRMPRQSRRPIAIRAGLGGMPRRAGVDVRAGGVRGAPLEPRRRRSWPSLQSPSHKLKPSGVRVPAGTSAQQPHGYGLAGPLTQRWISSMPPQPRRPVAIGAGLAMSPKGEGPTARRREARGAATPEAPESEGEGLAVPSVAGPSSSGSDAERLASPQPHDDGMAGPAPSDGLPRCPRSSVGPTRSIVASPE